MGCIDVWTRPVNVIGNLLQPGSQARGRFQPNVNHRTVHNRSGRASTTTHPDRTTGRHSPAEIQTEAERGANAGFRHGLGHRGRFFAAT
jgi:hypothetical protein